MQAVRLSRPRLKPGWISIVFVHGKRIAPFGVWDVSARGQIAAAGPPRLHPDLADRIELHLAMGQTSGFIRDGGSAWHWKYAAR
jgi:hypothetical protein